ncbi:20 kDa chaperonin [Zostera marina]|uniref:20 kDa chaperonin, chloroplastic n=1 Tax=Zostera marina TaxID=29655 RepID=A0A0K9PLS9_ZOSMR|nr:20 kDa chaperonin [Zostera marina]
MSSIQFTLNSVGVGGKGLGLLRPFEGLRPGAFGVSTTLGASGPSLHKRCFPSIMVKAVTTVTPKYTTVKPLGDRVLVKVKTSEEKTLGGILLPTAAQSKPQTGEVVSVGEGRTIGKIKIDVSVPTGAQVVYSKYAGTEMDFNGSSHLILKEDDIVGVLETDDIKDLKLLNDRVLIKVAEAEGKTAGGLLLTEATKEKPSIGSVIAVGPGLLDEEGIRKPLSVTPASNVLFSKYAGTEFKGVDGSDYIVMRAPDVIAVLV